MQGKAKAKYIRMSPRKIRRVADLIRGKNVNEAISILHFTRKNACLPLEKAIHSAVANVVSGQGMKKVDVDRLFVKKITVDGGPTLKRFRPMSMGRAGRIRKRTSHITVVVSE
jgi:large subunit ribosomal protein L22